jgi:hypothetical protein
VVVLLLLLATHLCSAGAKLAPYCAGYLVREVVERQASAEGQLSDGRKKLGPAANTIQTLTCLAGNVHNFIS